MSHLSLELQRSEAAIIGVILSTKPLVGCTSAWSPSHIAPRGAKKEEAFGGVILKSERPSGALFTNSHKRLAHFMA